MPGELTIKHELPFALMSDVDIAKIKQCREEGKDFVIECYIPQQENIQRMLGANTFVAYVREIDNEPSKTGEVPQQAPFDSTLPNLAE